MPTSDDEFRRLYEAHAPAVRRLLHRMDLGSELDDVLQEVFVKVHQGLEGFRGEASSRTWIYRVAVNAANDHVRKARRRRWLRFFDPTDAAGPLRAAEDPSETGGEIVLAESRDARVRAAIARLTPKLRETMVLYSLEELPLREIAAILVIPEGTVKSRLNQGRAALAPLLREGDAHG